MNKAFKYNIDDDFGFGTAIVKGIKRHFVEGYASTITRDKSGEVVDLSAQEDIYNQIMGENITLDLEHEEWYDENQQVLPKPKSNKIPVAKVVDARIDEKGVWIKAELNQNLSKFEEVWGSIKDGFLKAFSIAFYPIEKAANNVIKKLNLVNITLTGTPVNPEATFSATMKSASAFLKSQSSSFYLPNSADADSSEGDNMEADVKHKYIRREGKKGDYTYIYKDGSSSGSSGKKEEQQESIANKIGSEFKEVSKDISVSKKTDTKLKEVDIDDHGDDFIQITATFSAKDFNKLEEDIPKSSENKLRRNLKEVASKYGKVDEVYLDDAESDESWGTSYTYMIKFADKKPTTKSLNNNKEEDKMSEEIKEPEKVEEKPVEEPKQEEKVEEKTEEKPVEEVQKEPEVKSESKEDYGAEIKALKTEIAELKAELAKPVMKAKKENAPEIKNETKYISPLNLI